MHVGRGLRLVCGLGVAMVVIMSSGCGQEASPVDPLAEIAGALPDRVLDWSAGSGDEIYDRESIFSYIDGHAEVYLAYNMERCLSRRYQGADSAIVVDVFAMATAADAFGVFTHDLDGEDQGLGQGSRWRYGWLSLWKGPYFVSIYSEEESEAASEAVLQLGAVISEAISDEGQLPAVVRELPQMGLDHGSVRFLHSPQILVAHLSVGVDNPFDLGPETPTALATYSRDEHSARLLVVDYPDEARAETVAGGVNGAVVVGRRMAVAVEFSDQQLADDVLAAITPPTEGASS